ncbi:MAG: hypothetical protein ACTSRH_10005 [Promethearchaeota archaeon]
MVVKDFVEQTISIMHSLASLLPYPYSIEFLSALNEFKIDSFERFLESFLILPGFVLMVPC